jgi:vacuolar-type H+-ATPase subunit H
MIEIIEEIVRAEGEAETLISRAKDEATQKRRDAETALAEDLSKAKERARKDAQERIEATRQRCNRALEAAHHARSGLTGRSTEEVERFLEAHGNDIAQLIDDIVSRILKPEFRRS